MFQTKKSLLISGQTQTTVYEKDPEESKGEFKLPHTTSSATVLHLGKHEFYAWSHKREVRIYDDFSESNPVTAFQLDFVVADIRSIGSKLIIIAGFNGEFTLLKFHNAGTGISRLELLATELKYRNKFKLNDMISLRGTKGDPVVHKLDHVTLHKHAKLVMVASNNGVLLFLINLKGKGASPIQMIGTYQEGQEIKQIRKWKGHHDKLFAFSP